MYMRLNLKLKKKKAVTTGKHCMGQRETTAILLIYMHTWGIRLWSSLHCGIASLYFTLKTPRSL